MTSMLEIRNLDVCYGEFRALSDVTLDVERGQIVSIMGANGAGKSTLLETIAGLLKSRSGSICLDGKMTNHLEPHDIVKLGVSLVPEGRQIFSNLTVLNNLLIGSYTSLARNNREKALENVFNLFPHLQERISRSIYADLPVAAGPQGVEVFPNRPPDSDRAGRRRDGGALVHLWPG